MRRRVIIISVSVLTAILIAGFGVYWFLLRSNAPDPVSLEDAVGTVTSSSTTPVVEGTTTTTAAIGLEGTWTIAEGSFAGYRVREELATIGITTAAGRSEVVEGSLVIDGDAVTAVEVIVDVTSLRSDSERRDRAISTQALETRDFPTATFALVEPIVLPPAAAAGEAFTIPAVGDLTIHGVTNRVTIDLEAQLVEDKIVVVGSTSIRFAAYSIEQPTAIVVISVANNGIMEFQLVFSRAA